MYYDGILDVAALAGKIMLENGGEVYRVEETMTYVCKALGAVECESYASPTAIFLSITGADNQVHTIMRRIVSRKVDLSKVEEVNRFSRRLEQHTCSLEATRQMLLEIQSHKPYAPYVAIVASAVAAGSYAVVFGGGFRDFICALIAGCLVRLAVNSLSKTKLNDFFINVVGAMVAVMAGWLMVALGIGVNRGNITIATLMLLVPGLLITNAVRDIAAGDLVSGTSRCIEAFFVAIALACGTGVAHSLLVQLGGLV